MPRFRMPFLSGVLMLSLAPPALAVVSSDSPPPAEASAVDSDYGAGLIAWENGHWEEVIARMTQVIERRPWHDNAHNLLGYAYRKQGNYPQSLEHYRLALELNPHHRGALEYLGEAQLELGDLAKAQATLARLAAACRTIDRPPTNCEEWGLLKTQIDHYVQSRIAANNTDIDLTTSRLSEGQSYRVSYRSKREPIAINGIHGWVLHVENPDGNPVENADITVSGGMPEHDHGLPTAPQVTRRLGNGDYLVEGMKFHMNGWWQVDFAITVGRQRDHVTFDLIL